MGGGGGGARLGGVRSRTFNPQPSETKTPVKYSSSATYVSGRAGGARCSSDPSQMSSITLFDGPPPRDMNFGIALSLATSERIAAEAASSAASAVEKSIR